MKPFIFSLLLAVLPILCNAQWPSISGTDLNDKSVSLPSSKPAVIGLAFSQKAQNDLTSWIEPLYQQLLDPNGTGSWVYDGDAYLVIAFTGAKKAALNKARKKIQEAADKDFYKNVVLFEGSMADFNSLKIQDKNQFYVFAISPFGDVLVNKKGAYTQSKLDALCLPLEK